MNNIVALHLSTARSLQQQQLQRVTTRFNCQSSDPTFAITRLEVAASTTAPATAKMATQIRPAWLALPLSSSSYSPSRCLVQSAARCEFSSLCLLLAEATLRSRWNSHLNNTAFPLLAAAVSRHLNRQHPTCCSHQARKSKFLLETRRETEIKRKQVMEQVSGLEWNKRAISAAERRSSRSVRFMPFDSHLQHNTTTTPALTTASTATSETMLQPRSFMD